MRVPHDQYLALGEERGAGQLGERAGLELLGCEVTYVRVGVDGTGGRHHRLDDAVEEQVLLPHGERHGAEEVVGGSLSGGHRDPASHGPPTATPDDGSGDDR